MPQAWAAATLGAMSSMKTHSSGGRPRVCAACRKISFSGLRMPTSPDSTTVSNSPGKSARGYSPHPQELESNAVLKPAARSVRIVSYMAGTGSMAANMRRSRPSAATAAPSSRSSRAARISSNSVSEHSPRSSAWTGFGLPLMSYAWATHGRMTAR